ncbi:hypothetical protein BJY04DRAFT_218561 [Aspergillus karnatakaensis]|uniref:ribonuclease H family protein n=1 Tax=Aspergillus karnatakaensis TaxID=1810916 RepID=UPI003CCD8991
MAASHTHTQKTGSKPKASHNTDSRWKVHKLNQNKKKKKKKEITRNGIRQQISNGAPTLAPARHLLRSENGHPDVIIEGTAAAKATANAAQCSVTELVLWVDTSVRDASNGRHLADLPSSSQISPRVSACSSSEPHALPLCQNRKAAGAAVVYEEAGEWKVLAYGLPGVENVGEAELHAINQGLKLALAKVEVDSQLKKVVIFSDCQTALESLAKHYIGTAKPSRLFLATAEEACTTARFLLYRGISLELRWVVAHMDVDGKMCADSVAKNASASTASLTEDRTRELGRTVHLLECPYGRAAF